MLAGMRDQWIRRRTQLTNAIRGYAAEFGVIAAKGVNKIEALLTRIAEDETLPKLAKELFAQYRQDYARLQMAIEKIEAKLMAWHKHNELSRRLVKIPLDRSDRRLAAGHEGHRSGMLSDPVEIFSAWIGLTPKDHSTAGKTRLGVITRAGDESLRSVLVVARLR